MAIRDETELRQMLAQGGARVVGESRPVASVSPVPAPHTTPTPGDRYKSKTERRYAQLLDVWLHEGQVQAWAYEPLKLRLADTCFYTPDFLVIWTLAPWPIHLHEVKGWWRDDAKVKFKVAATQFPYFTFRAVHYVKGSWRYEDF